MMIINMTRTASLLLAFGFFFITACSTSIHTLEDAEEDFETENYQQALRAVNGLLNEDPGNDQAGILKGRILLKLAEQQDQPDNRINYYLEMKEALDRIETDDSAILESRDELITSAWQIEFNQGNQLLNQPAGIDGENGSARAIDHFENAMIFEPDHQELYHQKATAHYWNGDHHLAIETLRISQEIFDPISAEKREMLAYLLLEEGQIKDSIELYESLLMTNPDNEQIKHGLVNAYILDEQHQRSIELLKELVESQPDNLVYSEALATELFFHIQSTITEIEEEGANDQELIETLDELMEDLDLAEENYNRVREDHPDPGEISYITAAFYKNTAGRLLSLADQKSDDLATMLQEKAHGLLNTSIPIWNTLAENNPENTEIWRSIYQIYQQLDMPEEAEEAQRNANL